MLSSTPMAMIYASLLHGALEERYSFQFNLKAFSKVKPSIKRLKLLSKQEEAAVK